MKYRFFVLFFFFCSCFQLWAQEQLYFVQVGAYVQPEYDNFSSLAPLGHVFIEPQEQGLYRVLLGSFRKQSDAQRLLRQVQKKGYHRAFLLPKTASEQHACYSVQLAAYKQGAQSIAWLDMLALTQGQLYVQLNEQDLRLLLGCYAKEEQAQAALQALGDAAPAGASVRRLSRKLIHRAQPFEMQYSKSYQAAYMPRSRQSIKHLQMLLAEMGYYEAAYDGKDSPKFRQALVQAKAQNPRMQRSMQYMATLDFGNSPEEYSLQYYINMLDKQPFTAVEGLKQQAHPMARAYTAYALLRGDVEHPEAAQEINRLMHLALDQVFPFYQAPTRYDFSLRYAYEDMHQFIMHLRCLSEAVREEPLFPQWLFRRHPELCQEAFAPYWQNARDDYALASDGGSFLDFEAFPLFLTILRDFVPSSLAEQKLPWGRLNRLYAQASWLSDEDLQAVELRQAQRLSALFEWSKSSPMQDELYRLFLLSYYESMLQIEEHYTGQGFPLNQASALAAMALELASQGYLFYLDAVAEPAGP